MIKTEYEFLNNLFEYYLSLKCKGFFVDMKHGNILSKAPIADSVNNFICMGKKPELYTADFDAYYEWRNYEVWDEEKKNIEGFKYEYTFPAMDLSVNNLPAITTNYLQKKEVVDLNEFKIFNEISTKVYGEDYWDILKPCLNEKDHLHYIAYDKANKPVAICKTYLGQNSIGLYFVAVLKEERRKGYAEELSIYALEEAKKQNPNIKKVVLSAYEIAIPLYEKLGFKITNKFNVCSRVQK